MGFVNDYEIKLTQAIADQRQDPVLVIVRRKPFLIAVNGIARQFVVQNRLGNVPRRTATGIYLAHLTRMEIFAHEVAPSAVNQAGDVG